MVDPNPISAVLDADLMKVATAVVGDALSLGLALKGGYSAFRGWMSERRNLRASSREANAVVEHLLAAQEASQKNDVPPAARRQVLLIMGAFADAWGRCRAYGFSDPDIDLGAIQDQFAARLQEHWTPAMAADHPNAAKQELYLRSLVGDPLRTPWYQALWKTLTDAAWDPPLLAPDRRRSFEQFFRLAYGTALAGHDGEEVRRYLEGLQGQRADAVRQLLVQDVAGWGARHVFGNVAHHEQLPYLPLAEMYVEPSALRTNGPSDRQTPRPVLGFLRELLQANRVVVVEADMGLGKSLTARRLALDLAREYLDSTAPGPTCYFPVFIRCADDLDAATVENMGLVAQRALHRQARQHLGLEFAEQEPAFSLPAGQRVLFIVDGFDEVVLGTSAQERMFDHLERMTSADWRCVVLSRPLVLPRSKIAKLGIPVLQLQPWSTEGAESQAGTWLSRWNFLARVPEKKASLSLEEIAARKLIELAQTPILLFMTAFTWDELGGGKVPRVALYETFFRQIARGKHEMDVRAEHGRVLDASKQLRDALLKQGIIGSKDEPRDAMLWLMSRAAWKAHCLANRKESLYRHHVEELVRDELELRIERDVVQTICGGLLLALQSDPEGEDHALLFGHKSFREYLVGRFWATQLRRILAAKGKERTKWMRVLLEGELLYEQEERAVDFLIEIVEYPSDAPRVIEGFIKSEREELFEWASEEFNDESQDFGKRDISSIEDDVRAPLRAAALAIGSMIDGPGIKAKGPRALRSLLAWFWVSGRSSIVHGSKLQHEAAELFNADLSGADLTDAQLTRSLLMGSNLTDANLSGSDLTGANLSRAHVFLAFLVGANLTEADLTRAILTGADLSGANLSGANLSGANLFEATLTEANLTGANLTGALLREADLTGALLREADLTGASMSGAKLRAAILEEAILTRTDLTKANLAGANLAGANLAEANLAEANLAEANLAEANLAGAILAEPDVGLHAIYSHKTRWPHSFDPRAAGARLAEDEAATES
ncbi:pentapeptide repeat-containing protein [Hyalangium gracile]|uniref:pentapeptide repeat-containing protein n=1 Tax=Hyalangium gracile TaxID=394092 RepID=UPI001CCC3F67|nr:pentapeptide repeat-containing protein [Hyalangium gracile]